MSGTGDIALRPPSSTRKRWCYRLALAFIAILASCDFYALRGCRQAGGDTDFAQMIAAQNFDVFYLRSPLTVYLHQAVYHFLFQPRGGSAAEAIAVCSAVAGGLFVVVLILVCDHWLFLLFNLSAPFLLIFCGHVEHYAWVNLLLAASFLAVKRHLENGFPLWPAAALWLLAASFHMLAVFYAPAFLYLLFGRDPNTREWDLAVSRRDVQTILILLIAWALWFSGSQLVFHVGGLNNGTERLVPFFIPPEESRYLFTVFSWAHLKLWLLFHWKCSPLGLALLILLAWRIRMGFEKFLLLATACAFLWTWMWHPDRAERDWDLFANLALPLNLLVGLLLARPVPSQPNVAAPLAEGD